MILEFLKDSDELKRFKSELKWVDEEPFRGEGDSDWYETEYVYQHLPTKKFYSVSMSGRRSKLEFSAWRRNFKKDEPYVVHFQEVKPKEITTTIYEPINERH